MSRIESDPVLLAMDPVLLAMDPVLLAMRDSIRLSLLLRCAEAEDEDEDEDVPPTVGLRL